MKALATSPAAVAWEEALVKLLAIARRNEWGIIDSQDSNFLHDYRVALRKMRALIGAFKNHVRVSVRCKKDLSHVFRQTNLLRDLDVHLMLRGSLEEKLPPQLRGGLDVFFQELQKSREKEARVLCAYIESAAYQESMKSLEQDLHRRGSDVDSEPIRKVAFKIIQKRFGRICKLGHLVDQSSPDSLIHEIRIRLKKLRYLLDIFSPFFDVKNTKYLKRELSKLQTVLGHFNDTVVLKNYFLNQATKPSHAKSPRLALSLGGLIGSLHQEHAVLRADVIKRLRKFCRSKNSNRIRSL